MVSTPNDMRPTPFGKQMRDTHFSFAPGYTPLNHGSYGATPICVRQHQQDLQDEAESRADLFLRKRLPKLLDESRAEIAPLLGVPVEEVVFVPNATTGVNTVLRNLNFEEGDMILYFSTIYDACEKTIQYICESTLASSLCIPLTLPMTTTEILTAFDTAVSSVPPNRIKIALFDTILTFPGVELPWEALTAQCRSNSILSLIDGAHGVGHIDLTDLGSIAPDFFTTNCYKWLFTPRGSAILYVPKRNQHLIYSSLPTSHGFQPHGGEESEERFAQLFAFVGMKEMSPFLCVPKALEFREKVCGGEKRIRRYCMDLAKRGGERMAEILGTRVMRSEDGGLQDCCFAVVRLPVGFETDESKGMKGPVFKETDWLKIAKFINSTAEEEHDTFIPVGWHAGYLWARISAQVYLGEEDFVWAGIILKGLCERVRGREWE